MAKICIDFQNSRNSLQTQEGETLLAALRRNGYSIPAACGGRGRCGKCRVIVNGTPRLACKVLSADGDIVVLPEHTGGRILTETLPIRRASDVQRKPGYVAAIDLGTTTIALRVYDFASGAECATLTQWNKQSSFGGDVISRMDYILAADGRLEELSLLVRTQCETMLRTALQQCDALQDNLLRVVVAGNTVMQHIFACYPVNGIATAPFAPHSLFRKAEAKNDTLLGAPIVYAPCVSGYVGGDITAGILAAELAQKDGTFLFLDIGTNGEMALGGKEGMLCCAVASGPAFEGAGITCGMPGVDGAISHVRYDNGFLYDVLGAGQPRGLCGSGLVDLVAELVRLGCIDEGGRLLPPNEVPAPMQRYMELDTEGNGLFRLHKNVHLTARDVRNLQLAKAAVAGGIEVLLANRGITLAQLDGVYLAGGFGTYIDATNAMRIGLLPEVSPEKIHVVGNTSLAGAAIMALAEQPLQEVQDAARKMEYIELSGRKDFADAFTANIKF